jgi:hypothetical protein
LFAHRRALRGFTSVFLWLLLIEVVLLHLSSYDITTYGPPFALGTLLAYLIIQFENRTKTLGTADSLSGADMLRLVQAIDRHRKHIIEVLHDDPIVLRKQLPK